MRKKKSSDKIVTAEMNSLLWQLSESIDLKERLRLMAKLLAVYGLIHDTPSSISNWCRFFEL